MSFIKHIFWNRDQRRLRALWRLIGQLFIMALILIVVEGAVGFFAFGMLLTREGFSADQVPDPQIVQQFITDNPMIMLLSYLAVAPSITMSVWIAGRFLDRRPFADFGFRLSRDWWIDFAFGLLLGAFLMLIIFLIEWAAGWITVTDTFVTRTSDASFVVSILAPLSTFVAVGFYEELLSRGYHLQNMAEGLNWRIISPRAAIVLATLLSSAVFGIFHAANPNASLFSTLNIAFAGILLGTGFLLTGQLAIPIALHITWNFFQGNVFGFPVSGTAFGSATFLSIEQGGPDLWTGGAFGPEAGLLGLASMVLGILLTALWIRWRYGRAELDLTLAQPPTEHLTDQHASRRETT